MTWIKTSEQLPPENVQVLAWWATSDRRHFDVAEWDGQQWWDGSGPDDGDEYALIPRWWMPLPRHPEVML